MNGTILDYTFSEAFILLDDDSIITLPLSFVNTTFPIGSNINLNQIYNNKSSQNKHQNFKNTLIDIL